MSNLRISLSLILAATTLACGDDGGEGLPDGGFTTGDVDASATNPTAPTMTTAGTMTTTNTTMTNTSATTNPSTTTVDTDSGMDTDSSGTTMDLTATDGDSSSTTDPTEPTETDPTTEPTETDPTTEPTETDPTTEPTETDPSRPTETDPTETTDPSETDPTDTTETTAGMTECGNNDVEANEVCFEVSGTAGTGMGPVDVVAGDFNGDGDFDVLTVNLAGNDVSRLLGDGTGALGAATETAVGLGPTRVLAGELSGDANWDALVANTDANTVSVLISNGAGFTETAIAVGTTPVDLGFADLNGSGDLDWGVGNAGSGDYYTAINDSTGMFTLFGPWDTDGVGAEGFALGGVAVGAAPDSLFGAGGTYGASPGGGDGTFSDNTVITGNTGNGSLSRFNSGDVNGDGELDVGAVGDANAPLVLVGDGGGGTANFALVALGTEMGVTEVLLADVTGEGNQDAIVSAGGSDEVVVFAGDGAGGFGDAVAFDVGESPSGVAVADLNGDTVGDIIVSNEEDDTVTILLSNP